MPFPALHSLILGHANRLATRRPSPNSENRRELYFPPGGHTHDQHTIPPDRLHISLSDPVLVAAEKRLSLSTVPEKTQPKRSIIKDAGTIKTARVGHLVLDLHGGTLSQTASACHDNCLDTFSVSLMSPMVVNGTQATNKRHVGTTSFRKSVTFSTTLVDPMDDSCDISEVMMIESVVNGLATDGLAFDNSRCDSRLAPLASEMFKEELYIRGYLKRPASRRPSNVAPKSRPSFMFAGRKMFPKVLGRCQGRTIAGSVKEEPQVKKPGKFADPPPAAHPFRKDAAETPMHGEHDTHVPERLQLRTSIASVTLRVPHANGLASPGTDANTSASSESFDLHEFSYITAFTTPPSSPSIILEAAEVFEKGADLGDSKHAV